MVSAARLHYDRRHALGIRPNRRKLRGEFVSLRYDGFRTGRARYRATDCGCCGLRDGFARRASDRCGCRRAIRRRVGGRCLCRDAAPESRRDCQYGRRPRGAYRWPCEPKLPAGSDGIGRRHVRCECDNADAVGLCRERLVFRAAYRIRHARGLRACGRAGKIVATRAFFVRWAYLVPRARRFGYLGSGDGAVFGRTRHKGRGLKFGYFGPNDNAGAPNQFGNDIVDGAAVAASDLGGVSTGEFRNR